MVVNFRVAWQIYKLLGIAVFDPFSNCVRLVSNVIARIVLNATSRCCDKARDRTIVFTISVKCAVKNTASGLAQRLTISRRDSQRDAALRRVVTHGEIHQKLGSSSSRGSKASVTNVKRRGPGVRVRRQQHNERQIKHGEELP